MNIFINSFFNTDMPLHCNTSQITAELRQLIKYYCEAYYVKNNTPVV